MRPHSRCTREAPKKAKLARDGFKMAPKGQDRQNHSGRCFCLRGASARNCIPNPKCQGCLGPPRFGPRRALVLGPSWGHLERLQNAFSRLATHKRHCLKPSRRYKATPPSHETAVSILDSVCYHLLAPWCAPSAWCQVRKYPVPSARCPSPGRPQDLCAIGACTCLMHLLPSFRWAFRQPSAELPRAGCLFFRAYMHFLSL